MDDMVTDAEPVISPPLAETEAEAFATFVARDGRLIRLWLTRFGDLVLQIGERQPVTLDRFQVAALRVAMLATGER